MYLVVCSTYRCGLRRHNMSCFLTPFSCNINDTITNINMYLHQNLSHIVYNSFQSNYTSWKLGTFFISLEFTRLSTVYCSIRFVYVHILIPTLELFALISDYTLLIAYNYMLITTWIPITRTLRLRSHIWKFWCLFTQNYTYNYRVSR